MMNLRQLQSTPTIVHNLGNRNIDGNLKLNDIVYLGAHNCAMSECYGWLYCQQNVSITQQFEKYGARHFKVPLHWYQDKGAPEIVVAHEEDGGSNCKYSYAQRKFSAPEKASIRLKEIVDLAFKHDQEIIILKLESKLNCNTEKNGTQGWTQSQIAAKLHSLLVEVRADQRAICFIENNVPTLFQCRDNGKNLLITMEPHSSIVDTLISYVHLSYKISSQVDWQIDPLKDVDNGNVDRGDISNPFLEIHLNAENSLNQKINIFDKKKYNSYSHVRKRFLGFNYYCKKMPNFIVADFVDQGDLVRIIDDINDIINRNGKFVPEQFKEN